MARLIEPKVIEIYTNIAPCAHSCRYCLIGRKGYQRVPFHRFASIVERFIEWREANGFKHLRIIAGAQPSYNFDTSTLKSAFNLNRLLGWKEEASFIKLGGLRMRLPGEILPWLRELKEVAGLTGVHASLAGIGKTHDYWNRREGDFDYLFAIMSAAASLGLQIRQRLFVTRGTLLCIDELFTRLNSIPGESFRYLSTFIYRGFAGGLEAERLTEDDRDNLPDCLRQIKRRDGDDWLSEREWIERLRVAAPIAESAQLRLEVTDRNVTHLEASACGDVIADIEKRTRTAYARLPSTDELCARHANRSGIKIYASRGDVERLWLDKYFGGIGIPADISLTHLALQN